jgi:hypothetical protein
MLEGIWALRSVLDTSHSANPRESKDLSSIVEEMDEVLDHTLSTLPNHTGLNGGKFSYDLK